MTARPQPAGGYVTQGLHRAVQRNPTAIATICGTRQRTFAELADRVARLAGALRSLGVESGDRVAYLGLNSDWFAEYLLAVPWADAVVNPLNFRWNPKEIAYSLVDSGTHVLLVDETFAGTVPAITSEYDGLRTVIFVGEAAAPETMLRLETLIASTEPIEDARRGGDALMGLFYTGGTTGFPKGVMLSHNNLCISALGGAAAGLVSGPLARFLHIAPMFHAAGFAPWLITLIAGGTQIFVPVFEPGTVLDAIETHSVTDTMLIPVMIQLLLDSPDLAKRDLSSLVQIAYGGSSITEAIQTRLTASLPWLRLCQGYGQTELAPIATLLTDEDHRAGVQNRLRSGGRPAPHVEVHILDEEGSEVPRGVVGEIVCRGGNVMQGYWNKPNETAAVLRDGWLHTGDGGWMDDEGYVFVVDRLKDMIVSGGENVYSAEVENALASHPAVVACAVIGVPDPTWGERVHAVIVVRDGADPPSAEAVKQHVKRSIASYKAPRSVEIVEALPVTSTGKVRKRQLREGTLVP